jgi:transcriptional regulator with XRE-family HTH domain
MVRYITNPEDRPTEFGRVIARYRKQHSVSIAEFAFRVGGGSISKWYFLESGQQQPAEADVRAAAKLMQIDPAELLNSVELKSKTTRANMKYTKQPTTTIRRKDKRDIEQIMTGEVPMAPTQLMHLTPEKFAREVNKILKGR